MSAIKVEYSLGGYTCETFGNAEANIVRNTYASDNGVDPSKVSVQVVDTACARRRSRMLLQDSLRLLITVDTSDLDEVSRIQLEQQTAAYVRDAATLATNLLQAGLSNVSGITDVSVVIVGDFIGNKLNAIEEDPTSFIVGVVLGVVGAFPAVLGIAALVKCVRSGRESFQNAPRGCGPWFSWLFTGQPTPPKSRMPGVHYEELQELLPWSKLKL